LRTPYRAGDAEVATGTDILGTFRLESLHLVPLALRERDVLLGYVTGGWLRK